MNRRQVHRGVGWAGVLVLAVSALAWGDPAPPRSAPAAPPPEDRMDEDEAGMEMQLGPGPGRRPPGPRFGGRMRDGMGGPGMPMPPREPSDEDIEGLMKFMREHFPLIARRMDDLKRDDEELYRRSVRRMWPRFWLLKETYERDPEGRGRLMLADVQLEEDIRIKSRQYRQESDAARKARLGEELRGLLDRQFDVRLERRRLELVDLAKRLEEQTRRVDRFAARKQEMVQKQFERVTGDEELEW